LQRQAALAVLDVIEDERLVETRQRASGDAAPTRR
jgi:hypothetical protein